MLASKHKHFGIVKLLIEYGAEINVKDKYGNTPITLARHNCDIKNYILKRT